MILLSEDEIRDAITEYPYREMFHLPMYRAIAQAQAEKDKQENVDATTDYAEGKISTEKWAERLGVSVYALLAALNKYAEEGDRGTNEWLLKE